MDSDSFEHELPPRLAQPLWVHFVIDSAIAFVATALVLWFFGTPFWVMVLIALVLGSIATPLTRRWEYRQLLARNSSSN